MISIGKKIEEVFIQNGIKSNEFAKRIGKTPRNIYDIFKRESVDTGLLYKISEVLNHDFFQYYQDKTEEKLPKTIDKQETVKKTKILIELEFEEDILLNKMLKEKVLQILK